MERLTQRSEENGYVYFTSKPKGFLCHENFCSYAYKCEKIKDRKCPYLATMDRLADYEDTGLEPKEIECIVDEYGRCHTLRTSSAERLEIIREIPTERLRELVKADREGRVVVLPCKVGDTVWIINHHLSEIFENKVTKIAVGNKSDNRNYLETIYVGKCNTATFRKWKMQQIGKTVFLTREAAEAALKGGFLPPM